jgi:hypothetical protein
VSAASELWQDGGRFFTADITRRARWALNHNDGRPELAWAAGSFQPKNNAKQLIWGRLVRFSRGGAG